MALGWNLYLSTGVLLVVTAIYTITGRKVKVGCRSQEQRPGDRERWRGKLLARREGLEERESRGRGRKKTDLRAGNGKLQRQSGRQRCGIRGEHRGKD